MSRTTGRSVCRHGPPRQRTFAEDVVVDAIAYGDSAVIAVASEGTSEQRWRSMQSLADFIDRQNTIAVQGLVATFDSVLIEFDLLRTTHDHVFALVESWRILSRYTDTGAECSPRLFRVPVLFGGDSGPDLADICDHLSMSERAFTELYCSARWTIRFLGAPAGAPLADGSPFSRSLPRRPAPRIRVPAGSVAVSGLQTVIYPVDSPGGWSLIGRTPWQLADFGRTPFAEHRPGDVLSFFAVDSADNFDPRPTWIQLTEADCRTQTGT